MKQDPSELDFRVDAPSNLVAQIKGGRFKSPDWLYTSAIGTDESPWQGDFIMNGKLSWLDGGGGAVVWEGPVVLVSHGCDTEPDRDQAATMAPAFELTAYLASLVQLANTPSEKFEQFRDEKQRDLTSNQLTHAFYFPAAFGLPDYIIDFRYIGAIDTTLIEALFRESDAAHRMRLSERGHRLFVCKLAHHFAHAERTKDYPRT